MYNVKYLVFLRWYCIFEVLKTLLFALDSFVTFSLKFCIGAAFKMIEIGMVFL